jgi:hypothetical protein
MMTNVPPSSTIITPILINDEHAPELTVKHPRLILLAELSDKGIASLTAEASKPDAAEDQVKTSCEVIGPFADNQLAATVLAGLLPDLDIVDGLILESQSAEFWLSIPVAETPAIALNSWRQFETKKRYLEDCMEVASGLKFH